MLNPDRPGNYQANPPSLQSFLTKPQQLLRRFSPSRGARRNRHKHVSTSEHEARSSDSSMFLENDQRRSSHGSQITRTSSRPCEDSSVQAEIADTPPIPDEQACQSQADTVCVQVVIPAKGAAPSDTISRPGPDDLDRAISEAGYETLQMKPIFGGIKAVTDKAVQGNSVLQTVDNINSTYLQPFKIFNTVVKELADIHPYAKIAFSGLSCASQIILNQVDRDESVQKLLLQVRGIYELLINDGELKRISGMLDILGPMSSQIQECVEFIDKYSETQGFWTRLGKNVASETDATIKKYSDALELLVQKFRDHAVRDTVVKVHRVVGDLNRLGQDIRLDGMTYAAGAGINTTKTCLEGTRLEILGEIIDWIKAGNSSKPLFWLSGIAGAGKSAIAHTIGRWLLDTGGLGSFFCFDRSRNGDRRHEKLFSTVARDLADCSIGLRHAVAEAVSVNASLKNTVDVIQQWEKLVLEPILRSSITNPVLIVIDALDESGDERSREHILQVLENGLTTLPSNIRIFLTSRPLPDIMDALHEKSHVYTQTMDKIDSASTKRDVGLYISHRLQDLHDLGEADFTTLAERADGLFEWARLACDFIRWGRARYRLRDRFHMLVSPSVPEGKSLSDPDRHYNMIYTTILKEATSSDEDRALFQSTMQQIFGTLEPLPMPSLNAMRRMFPKDGDPSLDVEPILKHLGPLFSGITDHSIPVRPLHASLRDFLTDEKRSKEFFVDLMKNATHRDLAFASLRIMKKELRFNMCHLETSYIRNIDFPDLAQRIKNNISPHLSYSSRFWSTHVHDAMFDADLGEEVCSFVGTETVVYWFEALSLLGVTSGAHAALGCGMSPIQGHEEYSKVLDIAHDAQRFIRLFGYPISQSAPHLYLSALPLSPKNSVFASSVASKFTSRILRFIKGRDEDWPLVQFLLKGHSGYVTSVAFSLDEKWIASGSWDETIRIWDIETGEPIGNPLRGHRGTVWSVAFLPDGQKIVSCAADRTIRIWDLQTGLHSIHLGHDDQIYHVAMSPHAHLIASSSGDRTIILWDAETRSQVGRLRGHKEAVYSVAFSPDGARIVSGSRDHTIRVWDVITHQQIGCSFNGLTSPVDSVAWSQDGKLIMSGSRDQFIRFWNPETGSQLSNPLKHNGSVGSFAFSFDGKHVVSGSDDCTVRVWDVATRLQVGTSLAEHTRLVASVAISRDATRVVSGSHDGTVVLWDMRSNSGHRLVPDDNLSPIVSTTFLDDKQIVSVSEDGIIQIWDTSSGMPVGNSLHVQSSVQAVAFSIARKWVVIAFGDHSIQVWSFETQSRIGEIVCGHDGFIASVAISQDGKVITSGSLDKTVRLWNTESWSLIGKPLIHPSPVRLCSLAFSSDDRLIVSCSYDDNVRLWNGHSGELLGLLEHPNWVTSIALSLDSRYIVTGAVDGGVRLWDVAEHSCLHNLKRHARAVSFIAFSPDNKYIISGSDDHTICIYNGTTLAKVGRPLVGYATPVRSVTFSPDGKWIASSSENGTVHLWDFWTALQLTGPSVTITPPSLTQLPPQSIVHDPLISTEQYYVRLSPVLDHALQDSPSFHVDDQISSMQGEIDSQGWVMTPDKSRIIWIPAHWRRLLWSYGRLDLMVMPRPSVELDLSGMAHGEAWDKCWNITS